MSALFPFIGSATRAEAGFPASLGAQPGVGKRYA